MAIIETKEIGIDTGVSIGTFYNTEYVDGAIQLKQLGNTSSNKPIYEMEGYWESEVIDLTDKFREYDKVALNKTQQKVDVYAILTRTSDDGVNFNEYVATTPEGKVQSEMKRYIQVRLSFFAGLTNENLIVSDFDSVDDINNWENNEFIETDGVLKLKRNYIYDMNKDNDWSEEGSLHRKAITKSDWKKINSIGVE